MDTFLAIVRANAASMRGAPQMVFDWDKAASIIVERCARDAEAGLSGDWDWTGGSILCDGKPVADGESYTYLSSNHAAPQLKIGDEFIPCFTIDDACPWHANTRWPASAMAILQAAKPTK